MQTLLRDLAAAAERVSAKRKELDDVARTEKKVEELQVFLERLDANQAAADSVVSFFHLLPTHSDHGKASSP
jgi:hypothetical protein